MTATTTPATTFANLTEFLLTATPGDEFTEYDDRCITAYTLMRVPDEQPEQYAEEEGARQVVCRMLTTSYHGRPHYMFMSRLEGEAVIGVRPRENGWAFITRDLSASMANSIVIHKAPAKRFSAKGLNTTHAEATAVVNMA